MDIVKRSMFAFGDNSNSSPIGVPRQGGAGPIMPSPNRAVYANNNLLDSPILPSTPFNPENFTRPNSLMSSSSAYGNPSLAIMDNTVISRREQTPRSATGPVPSTMRITSQKTGMQHLVASRMTAQNNIIVTITDVLANRVKLEMKLVPSSTLNGWIPANVDPAKNSRIEAIPFDTSILNINIAVWSVYAALQINATKFERGIPGPGNHIIGNSGDSLTDCSDDIGAPLNISDAHDLSCTAMGDIYHVSNDCAEFDINLNSCCLKHDISLWCSPNFKSLGPLGPPGYEMYLMAANIELSLCILGKFTWEFAANWSWLCGGFIGGIIAGAVFGLVMATIFLIGTTFGMAYYIAKGAYTGEGVPQFPYDGRNSSSCLCGGSQPTVGYSADGSPCRDMCKERGKPAECFDCYWKCATGRGGKPTWITDTTGGLPCCASTARQCTHDCKGEHCVSPNTPPKRGPRRFGSTRGG